MSRNILITGVAGFIGSNYVEYHLKNNPSDRIIGLDIMTYAADQRNMESFIKNPRFEFILGDIRLPELIDYIFQECKITDVIHFAAESHVDNSIKNPSLFVETNVLGTLNLLNAAKDHNIGRFHHISTDEVYGSLKNRDDFFTENSIYQPNSPYSASKAASDHLVRAYHETYNLDITLTNCSNNYGPNQHEEKLIPKVIKNAILGDYIPIYGNGDNIRDWLFVEDHCSAINLVFNNSSPGETYVVGDDKQFTNNHIVDIILNKLNEIHPRKDGKKYQEQIKYVTDRAGHDFRYAINAGKIKQKLGWKPLNTFDSAIHKTVEYYVNKYSKI